MRFATPRDVYKRQVYFGGAYGLGNLRIAHEHAARNGVSLLMSKAYLIVARNAPKPLFVVKGNA